MMTKTLSLAILAFASATQALLAHPALTDNLDYLNAGNTKNHKVVSSKTKAYPSGKIPADCKDRAQAEGYNPADIVTTYVTYSDCADPWVFCRHKESKSTLATLREQFGRVPVGMRDYVKHIITFPNGGGAYNYGGDIVFFGTSSETFDVWLHESAHSLDIQGAITGNSTLFSSTKRWTNAYNKDTKVADNYARTNQVENFAQETVVGIFDKAVPGGFKGVQPGYKSIQTQYTTVQSAAGKKIIEGGKCNRALKPSGPVPVGSASRLTAEEHLRTDEAFSTDYSNERDANLEANTKGTCQI